MDLRRCGLCGLVFAAGVPPSSQLVQFYQYERDTEPNAVTMKRYDELLEDFAGFRRLNRLLDVGCGAGHFMAQARKHRWGVYGTELAAGQCEILGAQGYQVFHGEFSTANWPSNSFDLVVMTEILEHLPDPAPYLHEAHRVLRPGGAIFITTPNIEALTRRLIGERWRVFAHLEHLTYFSPWTLSQLARRAGFETVSLRTTGVDPYEVLDGWRRGRGRGPGDQEEPGEQEESRERTHRLRQLLETGEHLNRIKRVINGTLNALGMGDTIKYLGKKPSA